MKCIGEKCKYYKQHDFYASCFRCVLCGSTRPKANSNECYIKKEIQNREDILNDLRMYTEVIIENQ